MERVRNVWTWVRSWRFRRRLTALENRMTTLLGELADERKARADVDARYRAALRILGGKWKGHELDLAQLHAWLGALVEVTDQNPARGREVRRRFRERMAAVRPSAPPPEPPAEATAAVANGATP